MFGRNFFPATIAINEQCARCGRYGYQPVIYQF